MVKLNPLMDRTAGVPDIAIGLIDGPVTLEHPDLVQERISAVPGKIAACAESESTSCMHGTAVAGILTARRGSYAPAICPECRLLIRPIFPEIRMGDGHTPSATPKELAEAIVETISAGARILNVSASLVEPSSPKDRVIERALDYAAQRGVIVVAAAGNQGLLGGTVITRHASVIPVVGCSLDGIPLKESNLGHSIGRRGLSSPGEGITSLGADGQPRTFSGTSAAAPFVTGAIALLWSLRPNASAEEVKMAITQPGQRTARNTLVPRLLDAWAAYQAMKVH